MYITVMQPPRYKQMTLDELLFSTEDFSTCITSNQTNTRTYEITNMKPKYYELVNMRLIVSKIQAFNEKTRELREKDRHSLYRTFHIPKRSGGLRRIDAPNEELMAALRELKRIFEIDCKALYHTNAFAYIKGRCTLDAVKRHQQNESRWFEKLDMHDFFGSTTLDFVMKQLAEIFPFSILCSNNSNREQLETALSLAFLDGGLPQGTPISPLITNIMMIPIDYALSSLLRNYNGQRFVYTRYADDLLISSKYDFNPDEIKEVVTYTLERFNAPFRLNDKKTRYGSSAGSNWNLGVMLNKDNEITIGHKKKSQFKAMLHNYVMDRKNGVGWDKYDVMTIQGLYSYYRMVEPEAIPELVKSMGEKMGVDILQMIKNDLL